MTIIIDKKISKSEFKSLLKRSSSKKKGANIKKLSGKLKWKGNVLKVQRSMRNER